jgi:hypothetical protein
LEILVRNLMHEQLTALLVSRGTGPTKLAGIHQLRNRIAHHEPIHNRPLARLHEDALLVAEWACPGTRDMDG